jgi:uncharacterized membrane protein
MLAAPDAVARLAGVDDDPLAPDVVRAVGARELVHALLLLAGSPKLVWTRVLGDAVDLAVLGQALANRTGERRSRVTAAMAAVAGIAALDLYAALGSRRAGQHGRGRPGPLHLTASTTIRSSPQEVYDYWRDLERLPTFLRHLRSVTVEADGRSTWVANAPIRRTVRWQAELTGDEPGRRISWKSLKGADIDNAGTVHFAETPDGEGTELKVSLHYDVPGGAIGRAVARFWGEEPTQQVHDDLRRLKAIIETGDVVRSDALPDGPESGHQMSQRPGQPPSAKVRAKKMRTNQAGRQQTAGATPDPKDAR